MKPQFDELLSNFAVSTATCGTTTQGFQATWEATDADPPRAPEVGRCWLTQGLTKIDPPCIQRLKPKHDKLLSNFAFKCNLRHYTEEAANAPCVGPQVEPCRFTPGFRS